VSTGRTAVDIVRDLVDAWNSHDVERIATFFHEDFENWQLPVPTVRGLDAYRDHLQHWFAAYPDLRLEIVTLFAAGDTVCLETRGIGTSSAPFFGGQGDGGANENRALDILELRDGKVRRERGYWDFSLFTGGPSPLAGRPEHRDAPGAEGHATRGVPQGPLCYLEFFRPLPGVPLETFHRVASTSFAEWTRLYPEDELIANLGRTWRMGPYRYLLGWRCRGIERWSEWNEIFGSGDVDDLEHPILDVLATDTAGFYRELVPSRPALHGAAYYLETFAPWGGAGEAYERRAEEHGIELVMLLERVGRLGPEPGGLALMALDEVSAAMRLQRDVPPAVADAGVYAPIGSEIL
jgi:predicted ester cyclase